MTPPRIVATALLLISVLATGMLVFQHFVASAAIPGCAPGGACAQAAESVWGKVPGTEIPVSFAGLAYYIALLVAYLVWRGEIGALKWVVRLGAAVSVIYLLVILGNLREYLCVYCLVGHAGHLGFWAILEWDSRQKPVSMTREPLATAPAGLWAAGFVLLMSSFVGANVVQKRDIAQARERDLAADVRRIAGGSDDEVRGFRGRYIRGPEQAAIRVVVFTGYQCPECKRFEDRLEPIFAQRDDMSISVKHYPLNPNCNPHVRFASHPNACRAARAAEAAGIVGGAEAFWGMHLWLFDRSGNFTESELGQAVRAMALDPDRFFDAMHSIETLNRIHADIEEARELGIHGTPMVFINGVELRGWHLEGGIERAVEAIAATNPRPGTGERDQPPSAFEKHLEDWRFMGAATLGPTTPARTMGSDRPRVIIDAWGDQFTEPVVELDRAVREILSERDDVRYRFRHFPMDRTCNPNLTTTANPNACLAARALEAAARLGDQDGFRAMHDWLFEAGGGIDFQAIVDAAPGLGFEVGPLVAEMNSDAVMEAIQRDIAEAQRLGIRQIPLVFVNSRFVWRWHLEGHDVLRTIIDEAAQGEETTLVR